MGEAFEMLRFAALSSAVHADAVECLVDDTRSVVSRIAADAEQLDALEGHLAELLEEQRRLRAVCDVLSRSRTARGKTGPARPGEHPTQGRGTLETRSVEASPGVAAASSIGNVLRFAAKAGTEEDVRTRTPSARRGLEATGEASVGSTQDAKDADGEETIDEQVERVESEVRLLDSMSVKTKLRELESLKRQVGDLNANAIMERYVGSFDFNCDVERLWNAKSDILNSANMDLFIARACQRFSGRCEDALNVISDFSTYEEGDAARVLGSLLYLEALTSLHNYDAAAVRTLQGLDEDAALSYYREKRRVATVGTTVRRSRVETVLGPEEFVFLPEDWWSSQLLVTPEAIQLPPARHILTPRFSFAEAKELNTLQSMRVDFQRSVLDAIIRMPKALGELQEQTVLQPAQEEARDAGVALLRLLLGEEESGVGVWATVARRT
ncbi:uncharacterized protein Tco025E_05853 [Trypanosoma conorhini]|uniref:Uncharacterized protein n=1 Tax=Trypanosoma conorhini TaxID=83891 RepID=A0A422P9K4_9TRYP|nr:uncharacterized protein Tco025E_05853 [Trypanosoma conorhini]RNF14411.1 hypothetical protein Tco025E_05853 [Trypanosoma conorhini]